MRNYGLCMQGADGVFRTLGDVLLGTAEDEVEGGEARVRYRVCARCGAEFARVGRGCYCERCAPPRGQR